MICFELFDPFEFEDQKKLPGNPDYIHMVGGVTHAIFAMEQIFEAPRLVIKLYKDPYGKKKGYPDLLGFTPENTPEQNALAANQHLGALVASLNYVMWGNFDGDGVFEFRLRPEELRPAAG